MSTGSGKMEDFDQLEVSHMRQYARQLRQRVDEGEFAGSTAHLLELRCNVPPGLLLKFSTGVRFLTECFEYLNAVRRPRKKRDIIK